MSDDNGWQLANWNDYFAGKAGVNLSPIAPGDIDKGIEYLRSHNYPKPTDCPEEECPKLRPACQLGICRIAMGMCGDF